MGRAETVLKENMEILHRLSAALIEREILDSEEIDKVMKGETLPPFDKTKVNGDARKLENSNGSGTNGVIEKKDEEKSGDSKSKDIKKD